MKKYYFGRVRLAFGMLLALLLAGCAKEPVFVDAAWTDEENTAPSEEAQPDMPAVNETQTKQEEAGFVVVHVCGAVVSPGVYELPAGSRIADAVDTAGGFAEDADESYVNLAGIPVDGEQIRIPTREEALLLQQAAQTAEKASGKVNINTADKSLLCTLPGIGEVRADSIIAYREQHGGFSAIEDIMQVSGIKESSFQKIKERIVVN